MFPSVQRRAHCQLQQLISESDVLIEGCRVFEAFEHGMYSKLLVLERKLKAKLNSQDFVDQMQARNVRALDDGKQGDVGSIGKKLVAQAGQSLESLNMLAEVAFGIVCTDESRMEHSPAYLLRAYPDASQAGLSPLVVCLATVGRRSVRSLLEAGRISVVLNSTNVEYSDIDRGLHLMK